MSEKPSVENETTICIFGDSITWGACDTEKGGWVQRLRNYFETNDYDINVYNCGILGDTTDDLLKRFKVESQAREPGIIMFAIGINDSQYVNSKSNPRVSIEKFQNNLQELIDQAKKFTKKIIFLGLTNIDESKTIPIPWDEVKYYDQENVGIYNTHLKKISGKNNLLFVDMLNLLSKSELEDGLHPNSEGHEKMFIKIKDFLLTNELVN